MVYCSTFSSLALHLSIFCLFHSFSRSFVRSVGLVVWLLDWWRRSNHVHCEPSKSAFNIKMNDECFWQKLDSATVYRTNVRKEYGYAASFASLSIWTCVCLSMYLDNGLNLKVCIYVRHVRTYGIHKRRMEYTVLWDRKWAPGTTVSHPRTHSSIHIFFTYIFIWLLSFEKTSTHAHIRTYVRMVEQYIHITVYTHLWTHFHIHPSPHTYEHAKILYFKCGCMWMRSFFLSLSFFFLYFIYDAFTVFSPLFVAGFDA